MKEPEIGYLKIRKRDIEKRDEILEKNQRRFEANKDKYYQRMKEKRQELKEHKIHCDCSSIMGKWDFPKH